MSLRRNTLWNLAGAGAPLVVGAAVIPYLVRNAGLEAFGILTMVWALIGYFSLFDLGLGRALTQQVAQKLAVGATGELPMLIKSGLLMAAGTGLAGGIALAVLAAPLASDWLNISPPLRADAYRALLVAAIGVPLTTATVGLRGVLEAYEDFRDVNLLRMLLGVANFALPTLSVMWLGPSLPWMVASLMAARLVIGAAHWVLVRRRLRGNVFIGVPFAGAGVRSLLAFGAWLTVSNVVSPLMVTADRFVVSAVLGAALVAFYTVPSEVIARALILPGALTNALFPRMASMLMSQRDGARTLYRRCVALVAGVLMLVCPVLMLGAHWGLTVWLGAEFADKSTTVLRILALGLLLNGIATVPYAAVQAAGHARVTAQFHLAEAVLYFPVLWFGLVEFGIAGAAFAWTLRVGVDMVLLLIAAERLVFRHNFRHSRKEPECP